jgi:hypothetical protein
MNRRSLIRTALAFSLAGLTLGSASAGPTAASGAASLPAPFITTTNGPQERPAPEVPVHWDELPANLKVASLPSERVVAYCLARKGARGEVAAKAAFAECMEPGLQARPSSFVLCHHAATVGAESEYFASRRKCLFQLGARIGG